MDPFPKINHEIYDFNVKYILFATNLLDARDNVESAKEGDDKSLSVGISMPPQEEEEKEEQEEEEWSSYPSPTPNNGNEHILINDDDL